MRLLPVIGFYVLSTILSLVISASPTDFNLTLNAIDLDKRAFDNAQLTFYNIEGGPGACGESFSNSDFVVALNAEQYGSGFPGPNCFRNIAITVNGKTVNAQIVDECPACPFAGLDLTPGLFQQWADLSAGILTGSWDFI